MTPRPQILTTPQRAMLDRLTTEPHFFNGPATHVLRAVGLTNTELRQLFDAACDETERREREDARQAGIEARAKALVDDLLCIARVGGATS